MRRVLFVIAGMSAACAQPTSGKIAGFNVSWTTKSPSITIKSSDGRELLSTAGPILESQSNFATYDEMFGAFQITEPTVPWNEPGAMTLKSATSKEVVLNVANVGTITISSPTDHVLALAMAATGKNRIRTGFGCEDSDHFLGFGSQTDAIDHHGHKIPIFTSEPGIGKSNEDDNTDETVFYLSGTRHQASYPLPMFLSGRGMAFLADTTRRTIFDLCQADPTRWSVETWDSSVTFKVYDGPALPDALERLTADTGRQPLASDLALAPWNDAILGSANVRAKAALLRSNHIPSSVIWTEDFRGGTLRGDAYTIKEEWDVDRTLYPDIEQLAIDLHNEGFRFLAYHNTFLTSGTAVYAQAMAADVFIKNSDGTPNLFQGSSFVNAGLVDLTNPAGQAFVNMWFDKYLSYGFDGWMADFAEWQQVDDSDSMATPPTRTKLFSGDSEALHQEYPAAYHKLNAAALAAASGDPGNRIYFSRSGELGDAPNQPVVWGGDQLTTFDQNDGFPTALMRGLNLGLGGIAIYGSDIGGYQNNGGPPSTMELFFRWTTLGALSPVMRTHHGIEVNDNWQWFTDAPTTAHFARWAQFHAALWPYLKAMAIQANQHGMPIMRALPLVFANDPNVWPITDEYMFGDSLLIAPVLAEGATSRSVYFPAGTWLPWAGGPPITGPVTTTVDMPLTEIGIYALAGSIVPMIPPVDTFAPAQAPVLTLDQVRNQRVLRVFAGATGSRTDVDGSIYSVNSSTADDVVAVRWDGRTLQSCATNQPPCADIDTTNRLVTVQVGGSVSAMQFDTATSSSAVAFTNGMTSVNEVDYRY